MESTFFQRLRERRVPQLVSLYLGCSWAVLQFVDWLVKRYLLSRHLTDAFLLILASLLPAVCLLAYTHGAPGRDRWGKAEKLGVPANLLLTVFLVVFVFAGKDLGAASRTVKTVDEQGREVERLVPKEESRRRVAIYFLDSGASGDGESQDRWLRYGIPLLLAADVNEDPFVLASTPLSGSEGRSMSRLQRSGFQDGLDVPRQLMRHVTEERHLDRFVAGRVERRGEDYAIDLTLYGVGSAEALAETSVAGGDLFGLIDGLTAWLKDALDVHAGGARLAEDLPVADRFSESVEAVRFYIEGQLDVAVANDYPAAIESLTRAVELDPTFAAASFALSQVYTQQGEAEIAMRHILQSLQHEYKLTERQRLAAKGWKYFLDGDVAKRAALYEMWTDLYPDDVEAHTTLAFIYLWTGNRLDAAAASFERALEIDPSADWILRQLASVRATQGDFAAALELHRRYAELHPDDHMTNHYIGSVHQMAGDLDAAREHYEKAHLLSSGRVSPPLALADVAMREGRVADAMERIDEASATATTPNQKSLVLHRRVEVFYVTGRPKAALELMPEMLEQDRLYRQPIDVAFLHMIHAELYVEGGRGREMETYIEGYADLLKPPIDGFLHLGHMLLAVGRDDAKAIERHRATLESFLRDWQRDDLLFLTARAAGHALELRGETDAAARAYRRALELYETSSSQGFDPLFEDRTATRLASLERRRGNPDAAEEQLERVFRSFPAWPEANLEMARLLLDRGDETGARKYLEKARHMLQGADPDLPLAQELAALR